MTSTTLQNKNFQAASPTVGAAFRQLLAALVAVLPVPAKAERVTSVTEQANEVRELAYDYLATDPGYAEDLFAAADRHELAHHDAAKNA